MTSETHLHSLSDDDLLESLASTLSRSRRVDADVIAYIAEVDERRLYAREACSSMFAYCVEVLHLSEPEAYLRIEVARAARRHPMLLEMLADGRLHLSGIALLAPHLTKNNRDDVFRRAIHKTKRELKELVAALAPKPDVPPVMRKLPAPRPVPVSTSPPSKAISKELRPDGAGLGAPPPPKTPRPEPLAPSRYKVTFTASGELRDKIERLTALVQAADADADLATAIEQAVSEKLERLEAKRFAKVRKPRNQVPDEPKQAPNSRYIPAAVRRAVRERDGGRCSFVADNGKRCAARDRLEIHHDIPYARGGTHEPENLHLRCRAHNLLHAEHDYGKDWMDSCRTGGNRVREPEPVYFATPSGRSYAGRKASAGVLTRSAAELPGFAAW